MKKKIFALALALAMASDGVLSADDVNTVLIYASLKYAIIVVSAVPLLVIYPMIQRFFEKGIMMGSIKG